MSIKETRVIVLGVEIKKVRNKKVLECIFHDKRKSIWRKIAVPNWENFISEKR